MSDWISVKDKLPDLDQLVMVCFPDYKGEPRYAWGTRLDEGEGWLWGIVARFGDVHPLRDSRWNGVEADDDYPVQFWKPLDTPPPVEKVA